ncbi:MAG: ATP synthase F1 subunit gamma [Patescibacteria group bacterium]
MGTSTKLIQRRIKSVTNTKKITKAMELVAASKMRKAVSSVLASRPYAEAAWRAIKEMAKVTSAELHPLLQSKPGANRVLILLFTSDRGLCGGFNSQMFRNIKKFVSALPEGREVDLVTVGKKGERAMRRQERNIIASFADFPAHPTSTDVRPIADMAIKDFTAGKYEAVYLAFTDYVSALVQKPNISQMLPITRIAGLGEVSDALKGIEKSGDSEGEDLNVSAQEYLFEPSPQEVLDVMLPRLVEAQLYQATLETSASEHSARMVAMRSATDAAVEMIDSLTLSYNRARQAGITAEIAEIAGGKAALESNR